MRFVYNNKEYEVMGMHDIGDTSFSGFVVLFEIQYASYLGDKRTLVNKEDFLDQDNRDNGFVFEERRYIKCFPIDSRDHHSILENCEYFIDHQHDKQYDELKYYLRKLKSAIVEFEQDFRENNNTKGSLDRLEYAQSDIYDWVKENIEVDESIANFWSLNELIDEMQDSGVDTDSQASIREFLTNIKRIPTHIQIEIVRDLGFTPFEEEDWR